MSIEDLVKKANLTAPQVDALVAAIKQAMMKEVRNLAEERGESGYDQEGPPEPIPGGNLQTDPNMQPQGPPPGILGPQMGPPGMPPGGQPQMPQPDEIIRRQMLQAAQRGMQPGILNRMGG